MDMMGGIANTVTQRERTAPALRVSSTHPTPTTGP
jgi:hypothetical protein